MIMFEYIVFLIAFVKNEGNKKEPEEEEDGGGAIEGGGNMVGNERYKNATAIAVKLSTYVVIVLMRIIDKTEMPNRQPRLSLVLPRNLTSVI